MNVKILKVADDELVGATISEGGKTKLPSIHDGWRFNFDKHSKNLPNAETYILVSEESADVVEGCLIFQLIDKKVPYMSFVEVAPHNRADPKKYDYVAGCLIAFAFKLAVRKGKGDYKAQLFFDVSEESEEDERKLIALYRKKYKALHMGGTRLVIIDQAGYDLEVLYLNRK
ncbi:MAG: hypothetical protein WDO19_24445 [Bacteroidota bacterium]